MIEAEGCQSNANMEMLQAADEGRCEGGLRKSLSLTFSNMVGFDETAVVVVPISHHRPKQSSSCRVPSCKSWLDEETSVEIDQ